MENRQPMCAKCPFPKQERQCVREDGKCRDDCPTVRRAPLIAASLERALADERRKFVLEAALQEEAGYADSAPPRRPVATRLEETARFARRMGYTRLGLAFCMGLRKEAAIVNRYLEAWGFTVVSVACKVGRVPKGALAAPGAEPAPARPDESMCNPNMQAMLMNEQRVDFNILVGLCVGHDSLFFKTADAPCTVLIAKDRLLAHNPAGAIYQYDAYYRCLAEEAAAAGTDAPAE